MKKLLALGICFALTSTAVGQVGPDGFGYIGEAVTYTWEDITGTGTSIPTSDDGNYWIPGGIGFEFPYYDELKTDLRVHYNGMISFHEDDGYMSYTNYEMPYSGYNQDFIAMYWDDLDSAHSGTETTTIHYETLGDAPNQRLIVQFTNVPHYPDSDEEYNTFQTVLFEDGTIEMRYQEVTQDDSDGGWGLTVGIQGLFDDPEVLTGLTWAHNDDGPYFIDDVTAVRFIPEPASLSLLALGCLVLLRRR